jgi:hypothetical protein
MSDGGCKGCGLFVAKSQRLQEMADGKGEVGECRRYPPSRSRFVGNIEWQDVWPIVRRDDWCGEWRRRAK